MEAIMRQATKKEFKQAIANARWPQPERCYAGRCEDYYYKDAEGVRDYIGTDVAHKTVITTRGKRSETYLVNPKYL
jgi:hypothetical protein